ncbi:MAG: hypothetical protein M3R13_00885 [Armatimonadota bacterium]|nr:hypothetical protein [Armatimonadota bacterium]
MNTYRTIYVACWAGFVVAAGAVEPDGFERADVIVIARVMEPAQWDKRGFSYEDGTVVPEETLSRFYWFSGPVPDRSRNAFWMPSVRFEPVLVLKGKPGATFRYTNSLGGTPTMGEEPSRTPPGLGGISTEDPTGKLFLLCLEKQTPNGRLTAGFEHEEKRLYMDARFADEYIEGGIRTVDLPAGQYALEGGTDRQRWSSIIVQAWQIEPDRPRTVLLNLYADRRTWIIGADGTKVPYDNNFARFAQEKLVPRLYSRPDANLLGKVRANYWSWWLTTNTDKFFPEYRRLVEELDRTWPNADPPSALWYHFDGLYGPQPFIQSLVSARTVFLRCKAVESLGVDHANLKLIVDRLRVEPSIHVQRECCTWLSQFRHKEYPRYADAPNEARDRNTITNLQTIIDYWSGK